MVTVGTLTGILVDRWMVELENRVRNKVISWWSKTWGGMDGMRRGKTLKAVDLHQFKVEKYKM